MDHLYYFCLVFVTLLCASVYRCLVVACLERLASRLWFVMSNCEVVTSNWYLWSGVELDCIDS